LEGLQYWGQGEDESIKKKMGTRTVFGKWQVFWLEKFQNRKSKCHTNIIKDLNSISHTANTVAATTSGYSELMFNIVVKATSIRTDTLAN